jgi:hypothetical protein
MDGRKALYSGFSMGVSGRFGVLIYLFRFVTILADCQSQLEQKATYIGALAVIVRPPAKQQNFTRF